MSEKLNIKISIADRVYPLTIEDTQEEALRTASKKIDTMIKQFEQSYAVRDKQDVLAMCALQFAAQTEQKKLDASEEQQNALKRLQSLDLKLSELLSR
ncbi:MAG: cell division protein ZapA [Flavobacteriaceae bacterium]|nr:cell division protein ZapA [Flavobacteriaceae bacterium]